MATKLFLSRIMQMSWAIQRSKKSSRAKSLTAAWAIISNEDITVFYLTAKMNRNRPLPQKALNQITLFTPKTISHEIFNGCTTIEEVKAVYKKLAKQHHPDLGGDTATMQAINTEYAFACAALLNGSGFTSEETEEQIKLSEEYRRVIAGIVHLPGVSVEVVGNWIWVTGNTYPVRGKLKEAGLFFASKKQAWYYRGEAFRTKGSGKTLDEIRGKYGSEKIGSGFGRREVE